MLRCTGNVAEIQDGHCATSAGQEGTYFIASCPYRQTVNITDRWFSEMPSDPGQLDEVMCGAYNRKGLMCGECKDGYGSAVYSFGLKCANCSSLKTGYAILLYLFLSFVPTTVIFVLLLVFRFNIMSGPLLGYVLFCQSSIVGITSRHQFIDEYLQSNASPSLRALITFSVTVSQLWNLQFFNTLIPPFCISEKLTSIHIHMLKFVQITYPFVLVIITCVFMELEERYYRVFRRLNPFRMCRRVTSGAMFKTFASFIFLSNISVLFEMFDIVRYTDVHNSTGYIVKKVLYVDPQLEWHSYKALLYILTAGVFFMFISFFPFLLLCTYPTRVYKYLSTFLSNRKQLAVTAFVEALNNCFEDGLHGTRDYRTLAGGVLFFAMLYAGVNRLFLQLTASAAAYIAQTVMCLMLVCFVVYVRPCKSTAANVSLGFHMTLLGFLFFVSYLWELVPLVETYTLEQAFAAILFIPHVFLALWVCYALKKQIVKRFCCKLNGRGYSKALSDLANGLKLPFYKRRNDYQELEPQHYNDIKDNQDFK